MSVPFETIGGLLAALVQRCKGSVTLEINANRSYHQTAKQYLDDVLDRGSGHTVDKLTYDEICRSNYLVGLQFYPDTPIGTYTVFTYDILEALQAAHRILDER